MKNNLKQKHIVYNIKDFKSMKKIDFDTLHDLKKNMKKIDFDTLHDLKKNMKKIDFDTLHDLKKNMKKIDFDTLHDLVCCIDYIDSYFDDKSYPIVFEVYNKNERPIRYVCGLTSIDDSLKEGDKELYDLIYEAIGIDYEIQFLMNEDGDEFLDLQDCDDMDCDEIEAMLKKKCKINEDSVIFLDEEESFNHAAWGWLGCELDEDGNIECECLLSDDLIEELRQKKEKS